MKKTIYFLLGSFVFLGVILGIVLLETRSKPSTSAPTNTVSKIPIRTFTSQNLGIQFQYASRQDGKPVLIKEDKDTVYIYLEGMQPTEGQFARVWTKATNDTLAETIKSKFLQGYDSHTCYVDKAPKQPKTGVAVVINYPSNESTSEPWWEAGKNCPADYTLTNDLSYFWTSQETLGRFAFLSLGQTFIAGPDATTSWAETLKFE